MRAAANSFWRPFRCTATVPANNLLGYGDRIMRAIAGAIVVLAGACILIVAALLPKLYLPTPGTQTIPVSPELMLWIGIATMAGGAVAIFSESWVQKGK